MLNFSFNNTAQHVYLCSRDSVKHYGDFRHLPTSPWCITWRTMAWRARRVFQDNLSAWLSAQNGIIMTLSERVSGGQRVQTVNETDSQGQSNISWTVHLHKLSALYLIKAAGHDGPL